MRIASFWRPIIVGALLTPLCLLFAIGSGGGGHGDYFYAQLLYPYTMLWALRVGAIWLPSIMLAIFQFPLYGLIYALAAKKRKQVIVAIVLVIAHTFAVILCLQPANPNYR